MLNCTGCTVQFRNVQAVLCSAGLYLYILELYSAGCTVINSTLGMCIVKYCTFFLMINYLFLTISNMSKVFTEATNWLVQSIGRDIFMYVYLTLSNICIALEFSQILKLYY